MTIPKIVQVAGSRNSEYVILMCTGCNEYYSYSVRQYKGDFGCNITEFNHFLNWAMWEAAKHECFLAGRVGYIEDPSNATPDDPLAYHVDFPQVEYHEDPWGGVGYVVEPENDDPFDFGNNCPTCGKPSELFVDGDCPACNPPIEEDEDDLDAWMDEELDLPPLPQYTAQDAAKTLDFRRLYETGPPDYRYGVLLADEAMAQVLSYVHDDDSDNYDWEESRFDFLYGRQDPHFVWELQPMPEVPPEYEKKKIVIEFDCAEIERRMLDEQLLKAGVYSLDVHGCLRDEKNRCLACLRPGPHLPFYWERE